MFFRCSLAPILFCSWVAFPASVETAVAGSPADRSFTEEQRSYWALQRVYRPAIPVSARQSWVRNPIDAFVLQRLESAGLTPADEADRVTLIRRASLDLTGLPPTPAQVQAFLNDESPIAFERVVASLLHSPHYGERWARHWLDVARFAESTGFEQDVTRPNAWRFRDYVIDALNSDKPYDRFVYEQIAGDELWPHDPQARIATAFNRHYPEEGNNKDLLLARQEILHDITDVVGATFLGLTFNCARCHDHKFDPILQEDYYRLQAFFANIGHDDRFPLVAFDQLQQYKQRLALWEKRTRHIWDEMDSLLATVRKYSPAQLLARYPDYVIEAVDLAPTERTPLQAQLVYLLNTKDCGTCPLRPKPHLDRFFKSSAGKLAGAAKQRFQQLEAELEQHSHLLPEDIPRGTGILDISQDAPPTHVLGVGLHTAPLQEVQPGFPSILDPAPARVEAPAGLPSTGRRSALAHWLVHPDNPLTARVMVNRIWHHHFGRGIVATPSDFGKMGAAPTHPELLDWLADEFIRSRWSIKHIHRLIVTSSTYRQHSFERADARRVDPDNRWLWRFPPQRMEAEVIRDSALAVSGRLNRTVGGPSVFPPLPAGRPQPVGGWSVSKSRSDQSRRSIYIFVRRNDRYPLLEAFDFPDTHESCARRNRTTTAPQALALLNSAMATGWAEAFAARVLNQAGDDLTRQVRAAYVLAYSRAPDDWEASVSLEFLHRQAQLVAADPERSSAELALQDFCLMLLNSNEFVYRF